MTFRHFLSVCAVLVLLCAGHASAQGGVYATVSAERLGGITCVATNGACAITDSSISPYGGNFGAYYDFKTIGPVRLGADLRAGVLNSNKSATLYAGGTNYTRHYTFLGGARASFRTPFHYLRPYAQISGGLGRTNAFNIANTYSSYGQVEAFLGLDIPVLPLVDFRAIEFGGGETFGSSNHSIQQIGAGVVFHLPR